MDIRKNKFVTAHQIHGKSRIAGFLNMVNLTPMSDNGRHKETRYPGLTIHGGITMASKKLHVFMFFYIVRRDKRNLIFCFLFHIKQLFGNNSNQTTRLNRFFTTSRSFQRHTSGAKLDNL